MTDVFDIIKSHVGKRFVYGTGDGADKLLDYLEKLDISIDGICVSDSFYRERLFRGMKVLPIGKTYEDFPDALFMMAFGTKQTDEIFRLQKNINLIYPEMPVCGNYVFTKETVISNRNTLEKVYSLLADELSKKVFENIIRFRLFGNISYLKECESPISEGYGLILTKDKEEIIFDCGAYTGDTADDFFKYSQSIVDFYAAEPCPKSFEKLKLKYGKYNLFNCAVGKTNGETDFLFSRGRGSSISDGEKAKTGKLKKVPVYTVDSLLGEKKCTIIKYDVEGNEENALLGSMKTIKKYHPNMLIAAYHKSEDIFSLPLFLASISEKYSIYLRHHPCLPSWETNVYAVYKN